MVKLKYEELNALKGKMRENKMTYRELSLYTGISLNALNAKLNGYSVFNLNEVVKIIEVLEIEPENINKYFFPFILKKGGNIIKKIK